MTITLEAPAATGTAATASLPGAAWQPACSIDDLEPAWGEAMLVGGKQIALFRTAGSGGDEIYATCHRDPHSEAPVMARGIVGSKGERPTVASPLLKQVYDLGTGQCFTDPALTLRTFRTRVVGGIVEVEVPA